MKREKERGARRRRRSAVRVTSPGRERPWGSFLGARTETVSLRGFGVRSILARDDEYKGRPSS